MTRKEWPVFILGCQRSGTSLLRRLLDSHYNIACPPESSFILQLLNVVNNERSLNSLSNMGILEAEIEPLFKYFICSIFEKYTASKNKKRWADKTPHYLDLVWQIDSIFNGELLYIGIVRHGLDVAYSLKSFDWGILKPYISLYKDKLIALVNFWRDRNLKILEFKKKYPERVLIIKYEDLTAFPLDTMRKVFDFLGEPFVDVVTDYGKFSHDNGYEDPKIDGYDRIKKNPHRYLKWKKKDIIRLYNEVKDIMKVFNYDV